MKYFLIYSFPLSRLLAITAWNRLRHELIPVVKKCGGDVITLHKLLGIPLEGKEDDDEAQHKSMYNTKDVSHIHFEEIYLFTVAHLEKIHDFMIAHGDDFTFSCNGDGFQLNPIGQELSVDYEIYYRQILAIMFPKLMTFQHSKRCANLDDKIRVRTVCDDLRAGVHIDELIKKNGWKVIRKNEMPYNACKDAHVAFSNSTVAAVNGFCHPKATGRKMDDFRVEDILLGKPTKKSKIYKTSGGGNVHISSNSVYVIKAFLPDGRVGLLTGDDRYMYCTPRELLDEFKRPYCSTVHSSQGLTLGSKLYIHNYGNFMVDQKWYFTAITRCSTLDIVFVRD